MKKPSVEQGEKSVNWLYMCRHASSVAPWGDKKVCRWGEAVERAVAARVAEERKTAVHASGEKLVTTKNRLAARDEAVGGRL
jgi:hypothetical protein